MKKTKADIELERTLAERAGRSAFPDDVTLDRLIDAHTLDIKEMLFDAYVAGYNAGNSDSDKAYQDGFADGRDDGYADGFAAGSEAVKNKYIYKKVIK